MNWAIELFSYPLSDSMCMTNNWWEPDSWGCIWLGERVTYLAVRQCDIAALRLCLWNTHKASACASFWTRHAHFGRESKTTVSRSLSEPVWLSMYDRRYQLAVQTSLFRNTGVFSKILLSTYNQPFHSNRFSLYWKSIPKSPPDGITVVKMMPFACSCPNRNLPSVVYI